MPTENSSQDSTISTPVQQADISTPVLNPQTINASAIKNDKESQIPLAKPKKKFKLIFKILIVLFILFTILIIFIVASFVATAPYSHYDAYRKTDIDALHKALELYKEKNNVYPLTLDLLVSDGAIKTVPIDAKIGPYPYSISNNQMNFSLYAVLLNKDLWCYSSSKGLITVKSPTECTP